jgi:hypothetical protein
LNYHVQTLEFSNPAFYHQTLDLKIPLEIPLDSANGALDYSYVN